MALACTGASTARSVLLMMITRQSRSQNAILKAHITDSQGEENDLLSILH